jgi:CBS domain-containing protein
MKLRDILTRDPEVVRPDLSIQAAALKMKTLDIGMLPVCNGDRLVGTVTDRDIAVRAAAEGRDPGTTLVHEIMTPDLIYAFEDQTVEDAAELMEKHQIRRLPVLNKEKRLVGVISLGDVAVRSGDEHLSWEILERISEPALAR